MVLNAFYCNSQSVLDLQELSLRNKYHRKLYTGEFLLVKKRHFSLDQNTCRDPNLGDHKQDIPSDQGSLRSCKSTEHPRHKGFSFCLPGELLTDALVRLQCRTNPICFLAQPAISLMYLELLEIVWTFLKG